MIPSQASQHAYRGLYSLITKNTAMSRSQISIAL